MTKTNVHGDPLDRPHADLSDMGCFQRTASSFLAGGAAGTFFGAACLAWYPDPIVTVRGRDVVEFTSVRSAARSVGRPALWFALVGATFSAVDCFAESARNKQDSWNAVLGGMACGLVMGSITKRIDYMTVTSLGMGLVMGALNYSGPDTTANPMEVKKKMHDVLPQTHVESTELAAH